MFVRSRKIIFKSNTLRSFFTTKGSKSGKSFFRLYSRTTKFGVNKKWMLPITVAGGILAANYIISNKESKSEELKVSYGQHNVTYSQGPQNAQQNAPSLEPSPAYWYLFMVCFFFCELSKKLFWDKNLISCVRTCLIMFCGAFC